MDVDKFNQDICEAFDIDVEGVTKIVMTIEPGSFPQIEITKLLDETIIEGLEQLQTTIGKFELKPKGEVICELIPVKLKPNLSCHSCGCIHACLVDSEWICQNYAMFNGEDCKAPSRWNESDLDKC